MVGIDTESDSEGIVTWHLIEIHCFDPQNVLDIALLLSWNILTSCSSLL